MKRDDEAREEPGGARGTTRRRVLGGLLVATAGYWVGHDLPWHLLRRRDVEAWLARLLRDVALPDPIDVGAAYLESLDPWSQQPNTFLDRALGDLPWPDSPVDRSGSEKLFEAFHAKLRRDFENGDTLQLRGWFVSRTEADLCALLVIDLNHGPLMPMPVEPVAE